MPFSRQLFPNNVQNAPLNTAGNRKTLKKKRTDLLGRFISQVIWTNFQEHVVK